MGKQFYTFEEILLGMYDEYVKNQQLLKQLNDCVRVSGNHFNDYVFTGFFKNPNGNEQDVCLYTFQQYCFLVNLVLKLYNLYKKGYGKYGHEKHACYKFFKEGENYRFKHFLQGALTRGEPKIDIVNQEQLNILIDQILSSDFMNLVSSFNSLFNKEGILSINASKMFLFDNKQTILYRPDKNNLIFKNIKSRDNAMELLEKPISEEFISDSIKNMIDTNLVEGQTIEIDKCHFNHITEFDMLRQDNGLRLVKKRK